MINWKCTKKDFTLIAAIARRAQKDFPDQIQTDDDYRTVLMDLNACHSNGCPLDLQKLLDAPSPDFGHDVFGISRFVDRTTGKMSVKFSPRCHA